jgi:hypothetical protein
MTEWAYLHAGWIMVGCDAVLAVILFWLNVADSATLGPRWILPTVAWVTLAAILIVLMVFAVNCWNGGEPDPPDPATSAIAVFTAAAIGIIMAYNLLYWTVLNLVGWPAFYAAAGTFTAVHPPTLTTTVGQELLISQGLVDLLFVAVGIPVALARAGDRRKRSDRRG